jgi:hypothetical protein
VERARAERTGTESKPIVERSIKQFRRDVVNGRAVVLMTGSHCLFVTDEAEMVQLVRVGSIAHSAHVQLAKNADLATDRRLDFGRHNATDLDQCSAEAVTARFFGETRHTRNTGASPRRCERTL